MPFNFGSLFSAVGRALPGWIDGERLANEDNWRDLSNYNQVQAGQFDNAWTEATWPYRLDNVRMNRDNNALGLVNNQMTTALNATMYPGLNRRAGAFSANAGNIYDRYNRMLLGALDRGIEQGALMQIDPALQMGLNMPSGLMR